MYDRSVGPLPPSRPPQEPPTRREMNSSSAAAAFYIACAVVLWGAGPARPLGPPLTAVFLVEDSGGM